MRSSDEQVDVYKVLMVIGSLTSEGEDPPYTEDRLMAKSKKLNLGLPTRQMQFRSLLDLLIKEKFIQVRKKGKEFLVYPTDKVLEIRPEEQVLVGFGDTIGESPFKVGGPAHRVLELLGSKNRIVSEDEVTRNVRFPPQWGYTPLDRLGFDSLVYSPRPGYYGITPFGKFELGRLNRGAVEDTIKSTHKPGDTYRFSGEEGLELEITVGDPDYRSKSRHLVLKAFKTSRKRLGRPVSASEVRQEAISTGLSEDAPRAEAVTVLWSSGRGRKRGGGNVFDSVPQTFQSLRGLVKKGEVEMVEGKGRYFFSPVEEIR